MRILYLTPDLFGPPSGIARYCRMVCRALAERGHRLSTVSLLDAKNAVREAKATVPRMRYQPCAGNRREFVCRAFRGVRFRPELILVGHPNFAPLGWALGVLTRAPVINFIYGIDAWEPLSTSRRRALSSSSRILSISNFTAGRASEENGVPLVKVRILHNCLDPNFEPQAPLSTSDALSILTVARISLNESYKGHDYVIRALPSLLQEFPCLIYNVVGDGNGRGVLESLAEELGVTNAVRFHGAVSEAELIRHYNAASVFVMPSRFEGFGFVFLEAMTYGKPVVAGNGDASPEVVADGETGFLVDPTSAPDIADTLARLLGDSELRERMGRAAVARVADCFGFERFQSQLLTYLAEVHPSFENMGRASESASS